MLFALISGCDCGDDDDDSSSVSDDDDDDNDDDDDTIDDDDDDDDDDDFEEGPYFDDFNYYWQTMDRGYGYFIEKNIDWDKIFTQYEDEAFSETDLSKFALMIGKITASLGDSHTWASMNMVAEQDLPYRPATGVCLERIGGKVFVAKITEPAITAGMELGDEVILLDGQAVDDVLAKAVSWEGCSSVHCCDSYRLSHVERFSQGESSVLYSLKRGQTNIDVSIQRAGHISGSCKPQALLDFLDDASGNILKYKAMDNDLGYIHLSTLSDSYMDQILQELDDALDIFDGPDGIIFDARFNRGGSDLTAMAVLSRFLDQLIFPVSFRYKNGDEHDDFTLWIPEPVLPGPDPVDAPVVFLINGACVSAADFFAAAASYVPTFTLMGTTTCGATGAPKYDILPASGITFYYSQMQRKYLLNGEQIEGIGIAPDIFSEQDPDDIDQGIDSQIQQAAAYLKNLK